MTDFTNFVIEPQGSFSLAQSRGFLQGFTPASGTADTESDALVLSFLLDKTFAPAAVALTQKGDAIHGTTSAPVDAAKRQVARMLALDDDGRGYDAMLAKDPALAAVAAKFPGFRPVSFASPYEAAVWGILAQRIPMKQAALVRKKIATALGKPVSAGDRTLQVFPAPADLLRAPRFPGVPDEKWGRLHGIAQAALDGLLDADTLRALPFDDALAKLGALRGVGAWTSAHVLLRGTGARDLFSAAEPRVSAAAEFAYGVPQLSEAEIATLAERWRPYRTWVMVLLALHLSRHGNWRVDRKRGGAAKKAPSTTTTKPTTKTKPARK